MASADGLYRAPSFDEPAVVGRDVALARDAVGKHPMFALVGHHALAARDALVDAFGVLNHARGARHRRVGIRVARLEAYFGLLPNQLEDPWRRENRAERVGDALGACRRHVHADAEDGQGIAADLDLSPPALVVGGDRSPLR